MTDLPQKIDQASDVAESSDHLENEEMEVKMTIREFMRRLLLKINKHFWMLFFIVTYLFFFIHSGFLLDQLFQDRIGYENKPNSIEFQKPEILICPSPFFISRKKVDPEIKETFQKIEKLTKQYKNLGYMTRFLVWDNLNLKTVKDKLFHKLNNFFIDLNCGDYKFPKYKIEINPVHFLCYRFTKASCRITNNILLKGRLYIDSYTEKSEFDRILENENDDYSSLKINNLSLEEIFTSVNLDHESNSLVYFYFIKKKHLINGEETHFAINGNMEANAYIQTTKYENQYLKNFPCAKDNYRYFYNLLETNMTKNLLSFTLESSCVNYEIQMKLYKTYNCVLMMLPIPYPDIPLPFNSCFNISSIKTRKKYMTVIRRTIDKIEFVAKKKCTAQRNCVEYKYNINVDKLKWPKTSILNEIVSRRHKHGTDISFTKMYDSIQLDRTTIDKWKMNFFKFKILAGERKSSSIKEYFLYTGLNFFSDIGGILGFYLGASILTIKEFGWSLFYSLKKYLIDSKKKKSQEKISIEQEV